MASKYAVTEEFTNFARACRIIVDVFSDVFWEVVIQYIPANQLVNRIQYFLRYLTFKPFKSFHHQLNNLCQLGRDPEKTDCDNSILYSIVRTVCGLSPPSAGWGNPPTLNATNWTLTNDLESLREARNKVYAHATLASINNQDFDNYIKRFKEILGRLDRHLGTTFSQCLNTIVTETLDPALHQRYADELLAQKKLEEELNKLVRQFGGDLDTLKDTVKELQSSWRLDRDSFHKDIEELKRKQEALKHQVQHNHDALEGRVNQIERQIDSSGSPAGTTSYDSSKRCIHEARTLIKDDERQGYNIKGKIVKKYSLLKEEMKRGDTKVLASALALHDKITKAQEEDVKERPRRRDAVEKLLKHVLGGDSETHRSFVSKCGTRANVKDVCVTELSEPEMDAFIGLELMDDGRCRRPPDETKVTFTEQQKCLLIKALNDDIKSEVSNDELLSRLCISVVEHTKVWNCEMGNEKRINKLIATMQECESSVLKTLCEILDSLKMKHIADCLIGRTVSDGQSSDSSPSAILKRKCSLCLAQIGCPLNRISTGSITFHLAADSNKWNELKENCRSGSIKSLIQQLYQILASNGDLGIGEYRMDVTIYTITHLGTKEAEKAFLHLSTDVDPAATGSDDGNNQLDVRFNPMLDHYDFLVEELDVTRLLLKSLVENECLADGDIEKTLAINSRSNQAEHLINKLIGHGQKCYNVLQEHLRVTDKDLFNLLQERDINLKREKFYAGTFVLHVTHTSTPEGDKTTDKVTVTCMGIINSTCHFQSKEETGQTLDTHSHDNHTEEERLKDETTLDQDDKWKAALVKAYASLMNEMSLETAVCRTNLLLENKSISEDQSHLIKRCGFRRETVGNLLHCVLRGDQKTWDVFKSGLDIIPEDITTTEQQEFLRLENLTFENGKRIHHQEPRLRLKEGDVVTLTCNFLSNFTAIDKLNDGLLSKFHFSRQEHEAILNCDRDILYRADLVISTMEQCSENIVEDFLSLLADVGLDDVVGQLTHHAAKERHEKGPVQQEDTDTGRKSLKWKLPTLRQYLLRKLGFYLHNTTGLGRIELVPRDSEAWTNLEKSGEIENLVPLLYEILPTRSLLHSSENRVLSLKIYIYDNHCRSRNFVSGRTAILDLIETTDEDTTTSRHGFLIDERHNPIEMHEELLLEGIDIPSLLGGFKEGGVFGHLLDIEAAGTRSRSKQMRPLLRRLSPTGRKLYNVLLLNVKENDPAICHELGAREKLAVESREYFTANVQATVIMQGGFERRTLQVNNPTFHFKLQGISLTNLDNLECTSPIMSSEHKCTIERTHFLRGCRVNVDLYRDMSWAILIDEVPAEDLFKELHNNRSQFNGNMFKTISTLVQKHTTNTSISKDDCDVTLLYSIIRHLTSLRPPTRGWGVEPLCTDISITDDLERMRLSRNKLYAHTKSTSLDETEFWKLMDEAENIVERVSQHLHDNGSENHFKRALMDIRYQDTSAQWSNKLMESREIKIENRLRIEELEEQVHLLAMNDDKVQHELEKHRQERDEGVRKVTAVQHELEKHRQERDEGVRIVAAVSASTSSTIFHGGTFNFGTVNNYGGTGNSSTNRTAPGSGGYDKTDTVKPGPTTRFAGVLKAAHDSNTTADVYQVIASCLKSVGMLWLPTCSGTAFRVGSKYAMTNLHVIGGLVDPLNKDRRDFSHLESNKTYITFSVDPCSPTQQIFYISSTVPYFDVDLDIAVVEIKSVKSVNPPPALPLCTEHGECENVSKLNVLGFGHPAHIKKTAEPATVIPPKSSRVIEAQALGQQHMEKLKPIFSDMGKDLDLEYEGWDDKKNVAIDLFKEKGSSGSPAMLCADASKVKVMAVVYRGMPDCLWELESSLRAAFPTDCRIELAVKMSHIYDSMRNKNPNLTKDVFRGDEVVQGDEVDMEVRNMY